MGRFYGRFWLQVQSLTFLFQLCCRLTWLVVSPLQVSEDRSGHLISDAYSGRLYQHQMRSVMGECDELSLRLYFLPNFISLQSTSRESCVLSASSIGSWGQSHVLICCGPVGTGPSRNLSSSPLGLLHFTGGLCERKYSLLNSLETT